ncbi:FtsK/SpoIIIE-like protein [Bacillus phage Eoghan]|uniref:FtsK/SpoIIIE ATPase n=2 Tax=Andromedavirus TaxID=1623275 RepID=M1HN63_9CAUD|nr:FtsK/SpoIIIE-like protein [Bacillus phage Eoghan]YP_009592298.1 FtsK/SpoIIIE-like protein [Bacillus phage Taylor]AGE60829.1 FtsK/SpoIIIE ATPase [Bacillus phage Eoghan]AGE60983.1 FtsK/SpoIIIE ATPase [Bacillus phage Taylor]
MIIELLTCSAFGGLAATAFLKKNAITNDSQKIHKIFTLSGLNVKDGDRVLTPQLVRKIDHSWGTEYKYRLPLGRSFQDFEQKQNVIQDGLNNRRSHFKPFDLKGVSLDRNFIKSLREVTRKRLSATKEVELSFDGLLSLKVYNEALPKLVEYGDSGKGWSVPMGINRGAGSVMHDFESIPHMVIGGATRYGKSNLINGIITSLTRNNPDHVHFHLIDLKGGIELGAYENMSQTSSVAFEPEEALNTLRGAYEAMRGIQTSLRGLGKKNVQEANIKDRHFIIIDEVGELNPSEAVSKEEKKIKEECQKYMSQIARLGAGLGFRQILATQYTTGDVIPRQCKQNSDAKVCFRVQSEVASRVTLDSSGAEKLPEVRGRALYQTADKRRTIQTYYIKPDQIKITIDKHYKERKVDPIETQPETRKHTVIIEEV